MTTRARANYEFTAQDRTRGAVRSVETSLRRLDRGFSRLGVSIAGAFSATGTGLLLDRVTADLQRLEQAANRLDFPVDQLQDWFRAARNAGQGTQQLETAIQRMTRRISQAADGAGEAAGAIEELGLDAATLEALDTAEAFELILDALREVSSDDYVRLMQKIFDSEGVANVDATARAIEDAAGSLEAFRLSAEQLESAGILRNFIDDLQTRWRSFTEEFAAGAGEIVRIFQDTFAEEAELSLRGTRLELTETAEQIGVLVAEIRRLEAEDPEFFAGRIERLGVGLDNLRDKFRRLQQQEIRLEGDVGRTLSIVGEVPASVAPAALRDAPVFDAGLMGQRPMELQNQIFTPFPDEVADETEQNLTRVNSAARELGFTFTSAFENAIVEGEKLSDVLKGLAQDIARIFIRQTITAPLANALTGAIGRSGGTGGFNWADSFDSGGPIRAGQAALVGVGAQPELFVPDVPGRMIPNAGGMLGGDSYTVNIQAVDAASVYQVLSRDPRSFAGMVRTSFARRGGRVDVG